MCVVLPCNRVSDHDDNLGFWVEMVQVVGVGVQWLCSVSELREQHPIVVIPQGRGTAIT